MLKNDTITEPISIAVDGAASKLRKVGYEVVDFNIDEQKFKNEDFFFETFRLWLNVFQADGGKSMFESYNFVLQFSINPNFGTLKFRVSQTWLKDGKVNHRMKFIHQ